jgi:hypothetical protein
MKQGELIDRTYLKFVAGATDGFDTDKDAPKKKNGYFNISTLTGDATQLSINALGNDGACAREVSMSVQNAPSGNYRLNFQGALLDKSLREVFLVDNFLSSRTRLMKDGFYDFTVTDNQASTGADRFKIVFQPSPDKPVVEVKGDVMVSNFEAGNQWYRNGEKIEGATGQSYALTQSGNYHVQVSAGGCALVSATVPFAVTGLAENLSGEVRVYPNPASSFIRIVGDKVPAGRVHYAILNAYGSEVQRGEISSQAWTTGTDITFANALQSGFYLLKLEGGQFTQALKFVVQ